MYNEIKKVCAVVVTYNRKEKLRKCIQCLQNQEGMYCDVLVVNNNSTDGTEEMIQEEFDSESIHYYNTGANLGGAGGFEFGVREAVLKGYDYVWMMDDDTWPSSTALCELLNVDADLHGDWGFLSSVAYWTDGSICRMNIQKKGIFRHIGKKEYAMRYAPVKMCSFVSLLVKSDIVKELGLPIGEYFIWTDDYEFTGRISRKYPCYVVPSSKVIHAMKIHTRVDFAHDTGDRIERYRYIYRNDVHCYRQYGLCGWIYIICKEIYTIMNVLFFSKEYKIQKIKIIFDGMRDGLSFNPVVRCVE